MQIDRPAAAVLRFAKIVKSHPAHHAYDTIFLDDGSIAVGVQKLATHASNNAGTVDMQEVDQDENDEWSPELQSTKDQTKRDIIAVIAMVGVTPVVIGTLPPAVSQMNFPDTTKNLQLDRHASDLVKSTDNDANYCVKHPGGSYIVMSEGSAVPDFTGMDYDKIFKVTKNTGKHADIQLFATEGGSNCAYVQLLASGMANVFAYGTVNIDAQTGDINGTAAKTINLTANEIHLN